MNDPDTRSSAGSSASPLKVCTQEIEELHQFFQGWLSGEVPNTDEVFRRLGRALAPEFQFVHPSGEWSSRDDILTGLRQAHGTQPELTIEIRDVRLGEAGEELVAATYEEWQRGAKKEGGRLSTVVFRKTPEAPNELCWLHVHETRFRNEKASE